METIEKDFHGGDDLRPDVAEQYRSIASVRRYHYPTFEWLGRRDPDFETVRLQYISKTYTRDDGELPAKYKELIGSCILAYRHYPSTKAHLARALREGATVREVLEALEVASVPGGQPVLHFGVQQLLELEKEEPELFQDGHAEQRSPGG
jgi:alkylhydroperoxidase/carboxymuconolactone decarboxylase family protein YurZ